MNPSLPLIPLASFRQGVVENEEGNAGGDRKNSAQRWPEGRPRLAILEGKTAAFIVCFYSAVN